MSHLADDTLKSESQRDLADIVFDVSSTAAAFGAGAVSLYRSRKGKQYLELLSRTREFARGAANELFSHSYNDLNSKTLLQMEKNFKKSWRNIEQDVKRKPIQLSLKDDNLITAAAEYTSLMKNLPNVAKEMHNGKLFSETMKRAGDVGPKYARQYADFLRDIISAGETPDKSVIDNIRREFNPKNDIDLDKLAQSSIAFIQKRRQEKPYAEFEDEILSTLREGVKEKFLNQKNLADRFGASYLKRTKTDRLLGDRPLTLKELLDKKHLVKSEMYHGISADNDTFQIDLLKNLEDLANQIKAEKGDEAYNDFMSLYVDKTIRKDDTGAVYSARAAKNFFSDLLNSAARTMPGKVLKLRDIEQSLQEPNFHLTTTGSNDPVLASILGNDKSSIVDGDFLRILNKTYSITENGLEHVKELDDVRLISSRFGSLSKQIQKMSGEESRRNIEEGTLRDWFDIGTTPGKMMFEEAFSKNKRKEFRDKINEFFDPSIEKIAEVMTGDEADIQRNFETIQDFARFLNKNIFQLSEEAVKKLDTQVSFGNAKYILSVLRQSDEEMMQSLLTKYGSSLRSSRNDTLINADLTTILRRYLRNNKEAIKDIALKGDRSNAYYQGNTPQTYYDLVRTELGKEFFLQYAKENESKEALAVVRELIKSANIQKDTKNPKRLAYTALFENELRLYQRKDTVYRDNDKDRIVRDTLNIFSGKTDNENLLDFRREIGNVVKEKYDNVDIRVDRDEVIQRNKPNKYIHIRKTYGAKYLIEQMNKAIKGEANLKDIAAPITQFFTAGRGNMKNVTTASMVPYTAISRLTEEMERIGLGFSSKYTDNFLKYSAHFGLKRIAPIVLGYNYYDWFDDTVQAVTGTGTTAMFFNGLANVDLGVRRINDTLGLTDVFSNFKDINPMAQYVFGKDEVQSYEERLDYYRNGYDPVRSGRFWIFASSNEFRGGKIQYFEPNLIRRLNSDYEDKAFYDGYFDKWSHSLLPTPLNPISPIIGILDPYWLESRFKDERPYALSAPLFSQNTPWGVILNPTIGEMIKPQKKMHQDRLYGGIDAKALLYQMNKEHFREEINEERANTIVLAGEKTNVLTYDQFDTEITTRTGWNPIWGYDLDKYENEKYGIAPKKDYDGEFMLDISSVAGMLGGEGGIAFNVGGGGGGISGSGGTGGNGGPAEFFDFTRGVPQAISPEDRYLEELHGKLVSTAIEKFEENLTKDAGKGRVGALVALKMITQDSPVLSLQIIRNANIRIKQRAAVQDKYSTMRGTVADTIYNSSESIADLLDAPIGTDMVSEAAISARLITGIYGYAAERFLSIGDENTPHIANAGNMMGFNRWFWDQGFGGLGGGASEIGRRFIPAFRRKAEINPLMNEMPDWLPERFRISDAFTLIPKGEMRLPGRGYEAINVLHPDAFGAYGIFDRFKILADVAPGSPEFKTYRKLAKQFVKNPDLIKEMQQIEERVEEQQKRHDFFNYRFAGKTATYRQEVVSRILDDGTFQIVGSRDTYKLAGIKINGQKNSGMSSQETLSQFLHPGQMVTLGMDEDLEARRNIDNTISAAVFADGENITETMLDANAGQKIRDGNNYADMIALHGSIMRSIGAALETAGHIDLPLISARWMRIRDPYETYLAEEVYGTPYQTWAELTASFLFPAYERAISDTNYTISGLGAMAVQSFFENKSLSKWESRALNAGVSLFNRGAFIGGALAYIIDTDNGKLFKAGQKLGSAAMILGNMWVSPQNDSLVDSMLSYGYAGYAVADLLRDKTGETSSGVIEAIQQAWKERKVPKKLSATYKAAAFGAAVGAVLYGQNISFLDDNPKKWIPDRIKEKRDLDEYFDRLNYIKFMGLYHKAAREALSEEGINVEHFFRQYEKKQEEIREIRQELADLEDRVLTNEYSRAAKILLRDRLEELEQEQMTLRGGEYTRSAALYKQAAENTMYYMTTQSNSRNWYDIIKALPKNERDYFHAFKDITDDDEREKIMDVASPMLRRALKQVWGMEQEEIESNESYFQGRNLPNFLWSGWNPKADLADVKVKTIKNESMLFSDFGIYESQLRDPDVINAPNLSPYESQDPITLKANLEATMYGFGLTGVEVSVEPKASSGIDAVVNLAIVTHYQAKSAFNEVFKYM